MRLFLPLLTIIRLLLPAFAGAANERSLSASTTSNTITHSSIVQMVTAEHIEGHALAPCYLHVHCVANAKRSVAQSQPRARRSSQQHPKHAPLQGIQKHTCGYCETIFLSGRLNSAEYSDHTILDADYIERAYLSGCVLYISLVNKLAESGHTVEDLLPRPVLYQDWDVSRYQDGRHLTLHLARGQERFCDGVAYRLYSPDSRGHDPLSKLVPMRLLSIWVGTNGISICT
jgi:hypothetical protein